ncbi:unnamed protein product (mitochondrion) [Plasmodiophora brassicae]|uniref:Uncharacterized protein n=1 Tax=Plasmodiophora brassicae TaxID=37360 RepID=A0A0G4J875_PLABS|nr:hypothetical protein PBRA_009459 [Plasmodiophora brassicae]SPR01711.1 unnamed protein product [Plasmodiophora brassicae]
MSRRGSLDSREGCTTAAPAFPFLAEMLNLAPLVRDGTPDTLRSTAASQFAARYQKYLVSRAEALTNAGRRWSLTGRSQSPLTPSDVRNAATEHMPDDVKDVVRLRRASSDFEPDLGSISETDPASHRFEEDMIAFD